MMVEKGLAQRLLATDKFATTRTPEGAFALTAAGTKLLDNRAK